MGLARHRAADPARVRRSSAAPHTSWGQPLLHLALFRRRAFSAGLTTQLVFWSGQASFFVVLALYLQQGRGLSPLSAGLVFTILATSYVAASARAPALTERHGRELLGIGALVLAAGHRLLLAAVADVGVAGQSRRWRPAWY